MNFDVLRMSFAAPALKRGGFILWLICSGSLNACRSARPAHQLQESTRPLSPYAESELARINGDCDENLGRCQSPIQAEAWNRFNQGQFHGITKSDFMKTWNNIKFVRTDPTVPDSFQALTYVVKFHILDIPKETNYTAPLIQASVIGNYARQCQIPSSLPEGAERSTYTVRLLTLDQPNLSRNLLTLARLGFLDGKEILGFKNFQGIFKFGTEDSEVAPYSIYPDIYGTPAQAQTSSSTPKAEQTTSSGRPLGRPNQDVYNPAANMPTISVGSLIGIATNPSKHQNGRQVIGTQMGIALYKNQDEERADRLVDNQVTPIVYGVWINRGANSEIESFGPLRAQLSAYFAERRYIIDCVQIEEPEFASWLLPGGRSPFLY